MNDQKYQGFLFFLLCLMIFATSDMLAKYLSAYFSVPLLVWARYFLHFLFMLLFVVPKQGRNLFVTHHPWLMILRGLFQYGSSIFIFLAFRILPLAETTALVFVSPLLVALLSGPLLGEKARFRSWLATVIGFCGVLLIVRPGGAMVGIGIFYALCSALCYALYQLMTRKLSASEPRQRQLFYIALIGTVASTLVMPFYWPKEIPSLFHTSLFFSLAACAYLGHSLMIRAFHQTPASHLAPLMYTQLIWATLFGLIIFKHLPDFYAILGMLVIGFSGLILMLHRPRFIDRLLKRT